MDWLTTGFSNAYGGGLAADTSEKVGNGLPTNTGTILITERGRLQQSLLSAESRLCCKRPRSVINMVPVFVGNPFPTFSLVSAASPPP